VQVKDALADFYFGGVTQRKLSPAPNPPGSRARLRVGSQRCREIFSNRSPPPPERKHTFGMAPPTSSAPVSNKREPLFLPSLSDSEVDGKHTLCYAGLKMTAPFS
jgi:hypothetical protein